MKKTITTVAVAALLTGFYSSMNTAEAARLGDAKGVVEEARELGRAYGPGILISGVRKTAVAKAPKKEAPTPAAPFEVDVTVSIQDPNDPGSWKWPALMFAYMSGLAYAASFLVYNVGSWLGWGVV